MVDLGFLLFYTFLVSFSFHSFLFKNLQDWTLNGKIVDSFFSHPIFFLLLLFKNLHFFSHPIFLLWFLFKNSLFMVLISTLDGKILDSYFSVLFSSPFPFTAFYSLQDWTLKCAFKQLQEWTLLQEWWVDVEEGAGNTTNTCSTPSIL